MVESINKFIINSSHWDILLEEILTQEILIIEIRNATVLTKVNFVLQHT